MKHFILLFLFCNTISYSQNTDYNTKKGFAVQGYDVVAYFNNEAKEGSKSFVSEFDGARFKFSSKENLDLFIKNPEKYIPQYGGYCAYAVALKGSKKSINPKTFLVDQGKLYLFYDAWGTNTLELWQKEQPKTLIDSANTNWNEIKTKK